MARWPWNKKDDEPVEPVVTPEPYAVSRPNAVVAAANRMRPDAGVMRQFRIPNEAWVQEAWRQYDINAALRYAATWKGNSFSRCRLMVVEVLPTGERGPESTDQVVLDIMRGFMGSPGKQAEMLLQAGVYLTVPGDFYLVAIVQPDGSFSWCVHSADEIRPGGIGKPGSFTVDIGDARPIEYQDGVNAMLIRLHRPHPRKTWLADSPTRVCIPILRELEQLHKYKFALMDSRLAGAGILLLPNDLDFPDPEDDIQPGESKFLALLAEAMMASIKNRGDARAVVPIVVQGPKESLGTAQWLVSPASDLSPQASLDMEQAYRALGVGLDMPPEALLGLSGANDWAATSIDEAGIRLHVEPDMALICAGITEAYLAPALEAAGLDPRKFAVWFDSAELVLRPNRATDAKDLFDRGLLSAEALRHACGFTELDAPQGRELAISQLKVVLMAAPGVGDMLAKAFVELFELGKWGITAEMLAPDPAGGTPNTGGTAGTAKPSNTEAPVQGEDGSAITN